MSGRPPINISGRVFDRLTVLSYVPGGPGIIGKWQCLCSCGKTCMVPGGDMLSRKTKSCGCLRYELHMKTNTTHGMAKTPEYRAWAAIKERCSGRGKNHKWYSARGITVCDRWAESFENFIADMGKRPSPQHSIERRDNDQGYSPANCYWATRRQQAINKRTSISVEFNGRKMNLMEACEAAGKPDRYRAIYYRVRAGKNFEAALEEI